MNYMITCSDCFENYSSDEDFSGKINQEFLFMKYVQDARVTRACSHKDMVEILLDHGCWILPTG